MARAYWLVKSEPNKYSWDDSLATAQRATPTQDPHGAISVPYAGADLHPTGHPTMNAAGPRHPEGEATLLLFLHRHLGI